MDSILKEAQGTTGNIIWDNYLEGWLTFVTSGKLEQSAYLNFGFQSMMF